MQYVRAVHRYWADPANNPQSEFYQGPMVDLTRAHLWAWDARPYPWFPGNTALWSDGANWARGHWVTGRATAQPLDAVIAEICARAGLGAVDVSRVQGVVRGMAVPSTDSPRAMLQALMLAYGIDAVERDGTLRFILRDGRAQARLGADDLVRNDGGDLTRIRAPEADDAGRVRLGYVVEGGDFDMRTAEAVFPDASSARAAGSDLPLVLPEGEARLIAERWLTEARVARDSARFALPPSSGLGAGDVVELDVGAGASRWRIDRTTLSGPREMEATRVDPGVYGFGETDLGAGATLQHAAPGPVQPVVLDLPLIPGAKLDHAPWLAVSARAWPGAVALHHKSGYGPVRAGRVDRGARVVGCDRNRLPPHRRGGGTTAPIAGADAARDAGLCRAAGCSGRREPACDRHRRRVGSASVRRGRACRPRHLRAAPPPARPAGQRRGDARAVARGRAGGGAGRPSGPDRIAARCAGAGAGLSHRPRVAPAGRRQPARFHPDGARCRAAALPPGAFARACRGRGRSGSVLDTPHARGGRPMGQCRCAPVRSLRALPAAGASWQRTVVREEVLDAPGFVYTAAMRAGDAAGAAFAIEVAQVSDVVGPGPFARLEVVL